MVTYVFSDFSCKQSFACDVTNKRDTFLYKCSITSFIMFYRITDDILAMARPSTIVIIQKNVIQQFERYFIDFCSAFVQYVIVMTV